MMHILTSTKDHIPLAKLEIETFFGKTKQQDNIFRVEDLDIKLGKRLAYTNTINQVLAQDKDKDKLLDKAKELDWEIMELRTFCVRSKVEGITDKKLAKIIWDRLQYPKVELKNTRSVIHVLEFKKEFYICRQIWENKKEFYNRKSHQRASPHPTSLDPRLARACVNISGIKEGTVLDPFCGSAGIIIEAGAMGLKTIGLDMDDKMITRAENNLRQFNIKNYTLLHRDSSKKKSYELNFDSIVTDVPYGKSSKLYEEKDSLYRKFLHILKEKRKKKDFGIVIIFPDSVNKKFVEEFFKIQFSYNYPIHRSLSRQIFVLTNR